MQTIQVASTNDVEDTLKFEFSLAPVDAVDDVRDAIRDVVKAAEAGETEIYSNYLDVRVIVTG